MARRKNMGVLITAAEGIELAKNNGGSDTLDRVREIVTEWKKDPQFKNDPGFDYWCMLAAIYETGRIQGMREEREKKKNEA